VASLLSENMGIGRKQCASPVTILLFIPAFWPCGAIIGPSVPFCRFRELKLDYQLCIQMLCVVLQQHNVGCLW
jgi:hypothetical protein